MINVLKESTSAKVAPSKKPDMMSVWARSNEDKLTYQKLKDKEDREFEMIKLEKQTMEKKNDAKRNAIAELMKQGKTCEEIKQYMQLFDLYM